MNRIPHLPYRADIDGLRAVAVVAVILCHAGVPFMRGGFAGVDVFFVISGFLITQLLVPTSRVASWRALGDFYLRRARRILPALFASRGQRSSSDTDRRSPTFTPSRNPST